MFNFKMVMEISLGEDTFKRV